MDLSSEINDLGVAVSGAVTRVAAEIAKLKAGTVTQEQIDALHAQVVAVNQILVDSTVVPGVTRAIPAKR